ncbi:MAG: DUF4159 domain-containing protein [Verrucomicrobia bacterium]|nr:DUF4159 domain-containing protein [Verrucomicrobiota bacterium]
MKRLVAILLVFLAVAAIAVAQRRGGRGFSGRGFGGGWGESYIPDDTKTAREIASHSTGTPNWANPRGYEKDVFTFVRVKRGYAPDGDGGRWTTDAPDSDLNLSYRLQQMTSMRVDPDGRFVWLTDKDLPNFPFIYMVEPGSLALTDPEIDALRKYLDNGGFLMLDDFWGEWAWHVVERVFKQVFPGRKWTELPLSHPIYHCVFEIKGKFQVPNYRLGESSQYDPEHRTWERDDAQQVHHRALFDDKGRMMVLATHNSDNGDGWEREGEFDYYFHNFSEKIAYPLGINIIFYSMTH